MAPVYDLTRSTLPRVRAEAGHAIVRFDLVNLRDPSDRLDIEVVLSPEIARTLAFELHSAVQSLHRPRTGE